MRVQRFRGSGFRGSGFKVDEIVKSEYSHFFVIPADPGSSPGGIP
jgi:hypothetical protein